MKKIDKICDVYEGRNKRCRRPAQWKVPMYGLTAPYLVCEVHARGWRESQPENVKALVDDTPWTNEKTGYHRESRITCGHGERISSFREP